MGFVFLLTVGLLVMRRTEGNVVTRLATINGLILAGLGVLAKVKPEILGALAETWARSISPIRETGVLIALIPSIYALCSMIHQNEP